MNNCYNKVIKLSNWIKAYRKIKAKYNFSDKFVSIEFDRAVRIFKKQIKLLKANQYKVKTVRVLSIPKDKGKVRKIKQNFC